MTVCVYWLATQSLQGIMQCTYRPVPHSMAESFHTVCLSNDIETTSSLEVMVLGKNEW
jgi:hypothetical protein